MEKKEQIIIKKCPYCEKEIRSLYQGQADYNLKAHILICKKKKKIEEKQK